MKATRVDGVYTADPEKEPSAQKYTEISYQDVLTQNLQVMDAPAISICREKKIPIIVFSFLRENSIVEAVRGEPIGTIIRGE